MSPTAAAAMRRPTTTPTMSFAWSGEPSAPGNKQQCLPSAVAHTPTHTAPKELH